MDQATTETLITPATVMRVVLGDGNSIEGLGLLALVGKLMRHGYPQVMPARMTPDEADVHVRQMLAIILVE
jgi:hypothetical protein